MAAVNALYNLDFSIHDSNPTGNNSVNYQICFNLITALRRYCGLSTSGEVIERTTLEDLLESNGFHYRLSEVDSEKIRYEQAPLVACTHTNEHIILILKKGAKTVTYNTTVNTYTSGLPETDLLCSSVYEVFPVFPFELKSFWDLIRFSFPAIRQEFLKATLLSITVTIFSLASPIITSRVVGDVVPSGNIAWIISTFVISVQISVYSSILTWIQSYYLLRLSQKLNVRIQIPLYQRILSYPVSFLDKYNVGDLSSRATAVNSVLASLSSTSLTSLISVISLIGFSGLMIYYDSSLSVPALIYIVIIGVIQTLIIRRQFHFEQKLIESKAGFYEETLQSISSIALTRTSGNEQSILNRWASLIHRITSISFSVSSLSGVNQVLSRFLSNFGASLIYAVLIYRLLHAKSLSDALITTSTFIVFISAFQNFSNTFLEVISVVNSVFGQTLVEIKRAEPLIEQQPESGQSLGGIRKLLQGEIEFKNVVFSYPNSTKLILNDVSFIIKSRQFNVLFGPSGCGKSTILSIILGFYPIHSGSVYVDGVEIGNLDIKFLRSQIGTVLQSPTLPPSSIRDALTSGLPASDSEVWKVLQTVNLTDEINALPMKLETMLSEGATNISGGQRQRLCIARALLSKPKMLLEDESTSALDNNSQRIIVNNVKDLGVTRVVVAHRLSAIRNCDNIIVIVDGKVEAAGSFEHCRDASPYLSTVLSKDVAQS